MDYSVFGNNRSMEFWKEAREYYMQAMQAKDAEESLALYKQMHRNSI